MKGLQFREGSNLYPILRVINRSTAEELNNFNGFMENVSKKAN